MPIIPGISGIRLKSRSVGTRIRLDGRVGWIRRCRRIPSALLQGTDCAPMDPACSPNADKRIGIVYLPWAHVSISISEAFVFTAVLLYGPEAGTLTVALDGLVLSLWVAKRRPGIERALFNFAAPAASAWCSAQLFFLISGISPLIEKPATLDQILPALIVFAVAYFAINSWLIAFVIALEKGLKPWDVWTTGFVWLSLNYFCGASVAVLLVGYNRAIDLRFVGLVVPLLLVLYFTFKTSTDRVADANHHVEELNTLYLSTIETLAMAIDAKDQITHGHIRRVQTYAVGLAKQIGVGDERLIKAIEAAALLHDMGKIAIPGTS